MMATIKKTENSACSLLECVRAHDRHELWEIYTLNTISLSIAPRCSAYFKLGEEFGAPNMVWLAWRALSQETRFVGPLI